MTLAYLNYAIIYKKVMVNTNTEDYKKLVEKSRRGLVTYLKKDASSLSEDTSKKLFQVINAEFRKHMNDDLKFRTRVEDFCARRRKESEKDEFYFSIMQVLVANNGIKQAYIEKYGKF